MNNVHTLILCGGVGTRLWPLSRTANPKQFQRIDNNSEATFFHATVQRQLDAGFGKLVVAVSQNHVDTVGRQLDDLGCPADIIAEPLSRNTGPAVLAAALHLLSRNPDAMLCVLPSDHVVRGDLAGEIAAMVPQARRGQIVLFGVEPEYPETGYGYIVDGGALPQGGGARKVSHFVEKPDIERASALISAGNAYWASGISLFRADVLVEEFARFDPETLASVRQSYGKARRLGHVVHLEAASFAGATNQPTESIIFEKSARTVLAPLAVAWSDVGAWSALHHIADKDASGNVISGDVISVNTTNSYIRASGKLVAVLGLDDVVVVDTDDALLVASRSRSQEVKTIVRELEAVNRPELASHVRSHTEWGELRHIQKGPGYALHMISIRQGRALNLAADADHHRMLTVAEGNGLYRAANQTRVVSTGDIIEVAPGATGVIYSDHAHAMQLVEVVCDVVPDGSRLVEPALQLVKS